MQLLVSDLLDIHMLQVPQTNHRALNHTLAGMNQSAEARELAQELLPHRNGIQEIRPLTANKCSSIWKIVANNTAFVLRRSLNQDFPASFDGTLAFSTLAAHYDLGPRVLGWDEDQRAILMQFVETRPPLPYDRDETPYQFAMQKLRHFHEVMKNTIDATIVGHANFPWNLIPTPHSLDGVHCFRELEIASRRVTRLFQQIAPWLAQHAVIIHGNFCEDHVLHFTNGQSKRVYIVDFDSCTIGHPFYDVASFASSFLPDQQVRFLEHYLERRASTEEKWHFSICQAALALQVAQTCLRRSSKENIQLECGLSINDLESILRSETCPSFTSIKFSEDTGYFQLRGIYALHEALKKTSQLLPGSELREQCAQWMQISSKPSPQAQ